MADIRGQVDAGFFELVHQMTGSLREEMAGERRQNQRQSFLTTHRIAPYDGHRFPGEADFFEVRCRDLTGRGFSFLMDETPCFTQLIAEFGEEPNVIHVVAEIVRTLDVLLFESGLIESLGDRALRIGYTDEQGRGATRMALAGCQFLRRVARDGSEVGSEVGFGVDEATREP